MSDQKPLTALRALVVEDEYFVADDLKQILRRHGADKVRLSGSVQDAMSLITTDHFDFVLLDINMRGVMSFSVADELLRRRVPFAFVSGYDRASIPPRYDGVPNWGKPYDDGQIVGAIEVLCRQRLLDQ